MLKLFFGVITLGFLLLVAVAALIVLPGMKDRSDANIETANLTAIMANIDRLFSDQEGSYGGLNGGMANQAGVFPAAMNNGDSSPSAKIRAVWGGRVSIRAIPVESRQPFYVMEYHDVNARNCLGFVSGVGPHVDQIHVNGTPIFTNESGAEKSASEGGRFNPSKAAEACSLDGNTHLVSLTIR